MQMYLGGTQLKVVMGARGDSPSLKDIAIHCSKGKDVTFSPVGMPQGRFLRIILTSHGESSLEPNLIHVAQSVVKRKDSLNRICLFAPLD